MAKHKYRFNPESLSYDKIEISIKRRILKFSPLFFTSLGGSVILYFIISYFIHSPKERLLLRENKKLSLQYEIMSREMEQMQKALKDLQYRDDNIYRAIFGSDPIPESMRKGGVGGYNKYAELQGYDNSELMIKNAKNLDFITRELYIQSKSFDEITYLAKNKEKWLQSIPAIQPVKNKDLEHVASFFGMRIDPIYRTPKFHQGIDFSTPEGVEIFSTGDGVVELVEYSLGGYGIQIVVNHGFGYKTRYAHMSKTIAVQGQKVKRGEVIGLVGNTGKSTGPHLHYEVLKNNQAVDPINYYFLDLSPQEYDRMIELSRQGGQTLD